LPYSRLKESSQEEEVSMNGESGIKLNHCGRHLLLAVLGVALAGSTAIAQGKAAPYPAQASGKSAPAAKRMAFEVVSIKPSSRGLFGGRLPEMGTLKTQPDGYRAIDQTMIQTIAFAYLPMTYSWTPESAPLNQPSWIDDEYDIQAKVAPADMAEWQSQGPQKEMLQAMLRTMLEERCKLAVHWVPGQTSGYALVVGKHGPKLGPKFKKTIPGEPVPANAVPVSIGHVMVPGAKVVLFENPHNLKPGAEKRTDLPLFNISMDALAEWLAEDEETPILDQTGLAGNYDVVLTELEKGNEAASDPGPPTTWDFGLAWSEVDAGQGTDEEAHDR
jgi:uncharacterized protein (TIGR03435 family)